MVRRIRGVKARLQVSSLVGDRGQRGFAVARGPLEGLPRRLRMKIVGGERDR